MPMAAESIDGKAVIFQPLPGFYLGVCLPSRVITSSRFDFFCDSPVIIAQLLLSGEYQLALEEGNGAAHTVRSNMFLAARWENQRGTLLMPEQNEYAHVCFMAEEKALERHFGTSASASIRQSLQQGCGNTGTGSRAATFTGIATPDAVSAGRHLLKTVSPALFDSIGLRCAALDFFARLFRGIGGQTGIAPHMLLDQDVDRLTRLKEHIEKEFLIIESVKSLCSSIGMCESRANKGFKQLFGASIAAFIHRCKMVHAHSLLRSRKLNVSQCAFEIGYSNISHFIAAFKKHYQMTPKEAMRLQ